MSNSDIGELFDRDPEKLNDTTDIPLIVARMREYQSQFELGVKPGSARVPKEPKPKSQKTLDLLKDLGLT